MTNKLNVDRARFLAVAAALAGLTTFQACSNGDDTSDADDGGSAGTSSTAGTQSTAGAQSAAGSDSAAGQGGASAGSAGMATGGSTAGTTAGGASAGGANEGGAGEASEGGSAGAGSGACSDSSGTPLCDEVSEACSPYCTAATQKLKPAVAVAAINCLKADVSEGCAGGYDCLTAATAAACTEDVAAPCEIAAMNCKSTDPGKPSCVQLVSAFNDEGRAEMLLCLEKYCDSPYTCAEGFFFDSGT